MMIKCTVLCLDTQSCLTLGSPWSVPQDSSVPGDSPGKNAGVCCHAFLQGMCPTQGSNPGLLHCRWILYYLSHQGTQNILENVKRLIAGSYFISKSVQDFCSWQRNLIRGKVSTKTSTLFLMKFLVRHRFWDVSV